MASIFIFLTGLIIGILGFYVFDSERRKYEIESEKMKEYLKAIEKKESEKIKI
ncbi:hypothetical protein KAI52_00585 [Candidatus Parcubacteria bacterium]|nr:hypothetical protein [Candidatus Parcubacteria bacterium]